MTIYRIPAIEARPEQLIDAANIEQARAAVALRVITPAVASMQDVHRLGGAGVPIQSAKDEPESA